MQPAQRSKTTKALLFLPIQSEKNPIISRQHLDILNNPRVHRLLESVVGITHKRPIRRL